MQIEDGLASCKSFVLHGVAGAHSQDRFRYATVHGHGNKYGARSSGSCAPTRERVLPTGASSPEF
eukprot:3860466-Amphidinium_carterae.1